MQLEFIDLQLEMLMRIEIYWRKVAAKEMLWLYLAEYSA